MRTALIAVVLAATTAVGLAACGSDEPPRTDTVQEAPADDDGGDDTSDDSSDDEQSDDTSDDQGDDQSDDQSDDQGDDGSDDT